MPKGPVSKWYDLEVDGRTIRHAAWTRDAPELADLIVLSWQPGVLDRWLEEDEEVASHPRDPHKRLDALPSSRHVVISLNGVALPIQGCRRTVLGHRGPARGQERGLVVPRSEPAVGRIKDRIAFYNEVVDIRVDDVDQERPRSIFSVKAHRPGA